MELGKQPGSSWGSDVEGAEVNVLSAALRLKPSTEDAPEPGQGPGSHLPVSSPRPELVFRSITILGLT